MSTPPAPISVYLSLSLSLGLTLFFLPLRGVGVLYGKKKKWKGHRTKGESYILSGIFGISVGLERENDPGQKNSRVRNTSTKGDEALVLLFWSQNEEEEEDARERRADLK